MLRLIVDPRVGNSRCKTPPTTRLPSGSCLGSIEVQTGHHAVLRGGDADCCFYQYELPEPLRVLFHLPKTRLVCLPRACRRILKRMFPGRAIVGWRVRVVPMGWSWSVYLITLIQKGMLCQAVSDLKWPWLHDKAPGVCPDSSPELAEGANFLYIDNFGALAISADLATRAHGSMMAHSKALTVDATQDDDDLAVLLGFTLNSRGTTWRPSPAKLSTF